MLCALTFHVRCKSLHAGYAHAFKGECHFFMPENKSRNIKMNRQIGRFMLKVIFVGK